MMKWALLGAAAAAISSSAVAAQTESLYFTDGITLLNNCTSDIFLMKAACNAYIAGVSDSHLTASEQNKVIPLYCLRKNVKIEQLRDIVILYLQRNPQNRDLTASSLILYALLEGFPCPTE